MSIAQLWLGGASAAVVAYGLVRLLIGYATRHLLDVPNERSSHTRPTPRGGGAGICVVVLLGLPLWTLARSNFSMSLLWFILPAAMVALVGWLDDAMSLRARTRFVAQVVAASCVLWGHGGVEALTLPGAPPWQLGGFGWALALLWVTGLTNAFNFMDGIDGIAGIQAMIAGLAWTSAGVWFNQPLVAAFGALTAGASLGFLGHNWPPARVFMGDVGSTFLGFTLAAAPLLIEPSERPAWLGFSVLVVAPFALDATITLVRRLWRGAPVWQAHREHFYQRLVRSGRSHRQVTLLYAAFALITGALGLTWMRASLQ
jgi:UDP-N-acetylmuramyl pentapeptide phosphotransferase/UDP-N-acetylglucosamine-1-phosphate transferase